MTQVEQLAKFVVKASYETLTDQARDLLKIRILDSIGCAIGSYGALTIDSIRQYVEHFDGAPHCTLIGGGKTAPDRAALFNGALVRYLDFSDSYLAKGETCHPSDNLAPILAAAEYAGRDGRDALTALAVAYQVQCRLSDEAPVRAAGFDHTTQGSYAVAAGVSRALGLGETRTAHAIAIGGTAFHGLRVTRTGRLSNWKGLAYPNMASCCVQAAFLAKFGITGPLEVFEGDKGFMDSIAGPFEINWQAEELDRATKTIIKKYNAEIHSQSAIEGLLELKHDHRFTVLDVESVEVEVFDVAYHIIGGGDEGDKTVIQTKEDADHSLRYILAVALLDGQVMPQQYAAERITRSDVQELFKRINIRPEANMSRRFPDRMPCRLTVHLRDGGLFVKVKDDYEGFHSRPATWGMVQGKFEELSSPHVSPQGQREIINRIAEFENVRVADLLALLTNVKSQGRVAA